MAPRFQLASVVVLVCYVVMSNQKGTTPYLQDIFKGRCLDYIITRSSSLATVSDVNCDDLWLNFTSAWKNRHSCGEQVTSYGQLFGHLAQKLPKDKLLFWSGTGEFAHKLSDKGRRYITLEDTLVGSVADGLTWCGQTSGPGINYDTCPPFGSCAAEPLKNYWLDASRWFASQAAGEVSVVLNGSNPSRKAYSKDSIFGSLEVPSLQKNTVRKLTAIVVHDLGKPVIETCASQSLRDLKADIQVKNIQFDCYDNPAEVQMLLCLDSPYSPECEQSACEVNKAAMLGAADTGARLTVVTTMAMLLMINFS